MTSRLPDAPRLASLLALPCLALMLALPVPSVAAQEPAPDSTPAATPASAPSGDPIIDAGRLTVSYKRPAHGSARDLSRALQSLHGRRFAVRSEEGVVTGPYTNIDSFGDLIVLHDTANQVNLLSRTLEQLESGLATAAAPDAETVMHVREYVPRHQSVKDMDRALTPLKRMLLNASADNSAASMQVSNVTVLTEPAGLVLRDTDENLAEMLALLDRLDVPSPQVLVTCTLLRAITPESSDTPTSTLAPDLLAGLRQLVPYQEFSQVGFAALRVSVVAGREFSLRGLYGNGDGFQLQLRPAGYDAAQGLLSLDRCKFEANGGQQLETGLTLKLGEDTVLGASGVDPLFVVLRITPLGG